VLNICSGFIGGSVQVGCDLGFPDQLVQMDLHMAQVQVKAGIWWRFGGGSDRNRALLCNEGNSMHGMQMAQGRINTAYFACC
jgi:hypothetical protein